jgi:hypothetical protein
MKELHNEIVEKFKTYLISYSSPPPPTENLSIYGISSGKARKAVT